jgi:hypothetical protein
MGGAHGLAEPLGVLSHSQTSVHRPLELRVGLQQHHRANAFRQTRTPYWDQITQPLPRAILEKAVLAFCQSVDSRKKTAHG